MSDKGIGPISRLSSIVFAKNIKLLYLSLVGAAIYYFNDKNITTTIVFLIGLFAARCLLKELVDHIREKQNLLHKNNTQKFNDDYQEIEEIMYQILGKIENYTEVNAIQKMVTNNQQFVISKSIAGDMSILCPHNHQELQYDEIFSCTESCCKYIIELNAKNITHIKTFFQKHPDYIKYTNCNKIQDGNMTQQDVLINTDKENFRKIVPYKDWSHLPWGARHVMQFFTNLFCLIMLRFVNADKIYGDYVSFFTTRMKLVMWFECLTFLETTLSICVLFLPILQLLPICPKLHWICNTFLIILGITLFTLSALARAKGIEIEKMSDRQMVFSYLDDLKSSIGNFIAIVGLIVAIIALPKLPAIIDIFK